MLEIRNLKVYFPVYGNWSVKILQIKSLKVYFPLGWFVKKRTGDIKAVDDVNLEIARGKVYGLVGESGCGKTTLARTVLGLIRPTSGEILFEGNGLDYSGRASRSLRKKIQAVFQDPYLSLNPRMSIRDIVSEGIDVHRLLQGEEKEERINELLTLVGIPPALKENFASEFSAGQRQRIAIARSLAVNPEFIILDEPVSSLDVSFQKQMIDLLLRLKNQLGLTYLFISHDLATVNLIADKISVMYLGKIVESGSKAQVYKTPLHPYTKALFASAPIPDPKIARSRERIEIADEVPSAENIPSGCRFRTRCPFATDECKEREPELRDIDSGHLVACHKV